MTDGKNYDVKRLEKILRDYSAPLKAAFRAPDFAEKITKLFAAKGRFERLPKAGHTD